MPEIIPDPKEKTKVLYDAISKEYEVGSYDDFFNKLQDSTKRKTLYDAIGNDYDLGTFDDFSNKVVSKKKVTPPQPSPSSAISSQFREELSKDPNAGLKNLFAQSISEKQQQPPTQRVKDNRFLDFGETEPPKVSEEVKRAERLGAKPYVATESNLPDIKEAIDNAVEQKNKEYRAKGGTKLPSYVKDQVVEAVKNGDLVPVKENGKSVLKRGAGFFQIFDIFSDAVEQNHVQNLENTYVATLPKDKAISYLNAKMASPETFEHKREFAPSGFFGKVGEFLGENIPMLTKATAGAVGGTALAPETGGASFGMFLANARDMANSGYAQNLEKNYRGIKEQNPEISDSEAYEKANKAALVGEVTSLATNAVFSYAAPKNIQLPLPSVETTGFTRSLTHAIKSYPKVGVTAAAGSVINDIASNLAGNKVEAEQMGENAVESAKEMAIMHFGLWALGQPFKIPSYLRPQAENIVASAPREEVKQFYKGMEERGVFPEGTADKVVEKLNEFEEQKQVVNGMDLNEEQKASITGKLLQRKKIEEENKELKKYGGSFNARIENNDKAISKLDSEIDGIVKTGNVEKFEKDNLTGQTPTEIGKSVEEQLKPVEEAIPKVEEEQAELPNYGKSIDTKMGKVDLIIEPNTQSENKNSIKVSAYDSDGNTLGFSSAVIDTKNKKITIKVSQIKDKYQRNGIYSKIIDEYESIAKEKGLKLERELEAETQASKEFWNNREQQKEPTKTLTNEEKVKQLRAEEQAEYDAMPNPKDEVKRKEIYNKYDKLITPLLEKESSVGVGGDVNFTEVEDKKIKDIAIEANIKIGSYVKTIPTDKKNKFGNSINEYEVTNPFTNEKITFKKQGDATDYVIKEIAKATTKSGREEIFKAVEQSLKETPKAETKEQPKPKEQPEQEPIEKKPIIQESPIIESIIDGKKKNVDLSKGKKAEIPKDMVFKDEKEHDRFVVDNSENPSEIASIYVSQPKTYNLSSVEMMIAESSALSKKNMVGNDISFDAQQKFYKLTGIKLNDKVAEKAINYEFEKLNKEQKKLTYEQWKSEKELTDAYWKAFKQTDGFTKESNISEAEQPKPTTAEKAKSRLAPKQDIATQARDLANKLRSGEKQILPDWLKADLPKNTKLSGISFEEAAAKALEKFADVYEKVKDTAQAISEALVHLRDWHKENNLDFDEKDWTRKFEENLLPKTKTVGISHENLNKLAKRLGLKEVKRGQRLSPEEMAHRGRLLYKAGADVEQIAKDFESGMQPTADDIAIVRAHIEELAKKADALEGKRTEYNEATKELYKWLIVEKEMGTRASEPFTALQGERDMDTDSFTIVKGEVAKKMEKLGGINAKQERKIRELTEQNKKLKEEAKKAEKKAIEAANKTFGEGQQAQVTFTEKAKKVADNFRKLKTKEFIFRDENGNEIQVHKAGVSWNELVEIGAKAIEKTGEIADGVSAIIENIKDKEWYQKLSDKDKSNLEKQFTKQFEDAVEETPEAKLIRRLEKEKEDLENGIIKQKNVNNLNPTPEQKEKINNLKEEIKGLKENLGLIKSKQEKPLTEEEQIEQKEKRKEEIIDLLDKNVLRDLKNPKNMFSIEEKKAIWKYAKEEYLDKGVDYKEMISLVAEDLGLTWGQMNYAITTPEIKKISDEMWVRQSNYRKNQNATKRWVEEQNKNEYAKLLKRISDKIRGISVFGHGGIFVGTHAMMTLFDPLTWKQTVPAFFRAWKYAYGNKANYEIAMQELKNRDNYNMAQLAGLKNNPDIINAEEFQRSQNFLGKLGGAGEQGFNAIKVLRQDLFDYHWNKLTESEKLDLDDKGVSMAAKEIAWLINNATGATNLNVPEWLNEATFAGGMEMARWAKLIRNPVRAAEIAVRALVNPKKATSSEKVFARVWANRVGRQLGTYASALAINYALQNAINPKNKVNIFNPQENDFGKFKIGDITIDASSGMIGVINFIKSLFIILSEELEELGGDTRMEAIGKKSIQYLRGKLAPFYQKVSDVAFNTDFSGNVLPYSSDKPRQGKHKLGWTEYLWQGAPLPIAEAAHIMYETAAEHGGDPKIVDALVMAAISGGTGAKPSMFKEKQLQFSEEDKEREPFKFFVKKGVEFKELNPYKIEIEDEELSVKKPLDEYPKETIDNFKKIHKENLTESLEKIQEKGYVYIDKFGNLSISRGEGKPKEKIDLTELNKDQLKKIVSLLNSDATDKTKKEVFNQ